MDRDQGVELIDGGVGDHRVQAFAGVVEQALQMGLAPAI